MAKWVFNSTAVLEYPTLGFIAEPNDILDAAFAPDARWSLNADQLAAETVFRYTLGSDPNYIEPTDGHVLTYDGVANTYVPTAPETVGLPSVDAFVADKIGNDPTSASQAAVDARVATIDADGSSQFRQQQDARLATDYVRNGSAFMDLGKQAGVDTTGATDSTTALQAALDNAAASGVRAFGRGTIKTSSMVTISSDADLAGLTINYSGTGTAVRLGAATTASWRKTIHLGPVVNTTKTALGWAQVAGSVGVEVRNAYAYTIHLNHIRNFAIGHLDYGSNNLGTSYCTFHIGHLHNNQVNHRMGADDATSGYCNQNTYIGGSYSHDSGEGPNAAGTRHILLDNLSVNADPNNNVWVNPSIESPTVVEYAIDVQGGSYNQWMNPRLEFSSGNAKIRWGAGAVRNLIIGGNQIDNVTEEWVTGATLNSVIASNFHRLMSSTAKGGLILENTAGDAMPALTIMRAGGTALGDVPNTAYGLRLEHRSARLKNHSDAFERVLVDGIQGGIRFGAGTAAPIAGLWGTGAFLFVRSDTTTLGFETDNTQDIGNAGQYRPRYVRAATAVVTGTGATAARPAAGTAGAGAMFYDSTLGKPIWSNGSVWKDATGATV